MTVTQLHSEQTTAYPYMYRVDLKEILCRVDRNEIMDWAVTTNLKCLVLTAGIYLRTEADVTMFLLRWS
jgi:hypothetical protein